MQKKKSEESSFKKRLLEEIQSQVSGGLKRVSGNEILLTPLMDVHETPKEFTMIFSMPGLGKDTIDVRVVNGELIVEERKGRSEKAEGNAIVKEIEKGRYYRKIGLTEDIDLEHIQGKIDKGLLFLAMKKVKEGASPKKKEVEEVELSEAEEEPSTGIKRKRKEDIKATGRGRKHS